MNSLYNSPNMEKSTVSSELSQNQQPLGTQFKSYNLNQAITHYLLDPFQYSITKFDYNFPTKPKTNKQESYTDFKKNPGLIYKDIDFEKLLPAFTQTKKSVNDFTAQDYHRFEANEGYFNPKESTNNSDLWYYGAAENAKTNQIGLAGPAVNVQDPVHIIFPEAQRGGLDTKNLSKYSWSNYNQDPYKMTEPVNNGNCQIFNYNSGYSIDKTNIPFENVYSFDSNYCRSIGISQQYQGSMPFNPSKIA